MMFLCQVYFSPYLNPVQQCCTVGIQHLLIPVPIWLFTIIKYLLQCVTGMSLMVGFEWVCQGKVA